MNAKDDASYFAYAAGWSSVRKMPEKTAYNSFQRIADRLWKRGGGGVKQLELNLQRVRPEADHDEIRELSREGMRSYFRYWCDAFRMPDWSSERIVERFDGIDADHLDVALAEGKGCIVALPHMGNWDHAGAWATLAHAPVVAVAERLKPERLYEKFLAYRRSIGLEIHPLGTPNMMDVLAQDLADNKIVALLADRDLTARGIDVEFFGETTRMPAGAATLALRTGAPLMAASLGYDGPNAFAKISPFLDVPTVDDPTDHEQVAAAVPEVCQQIADVFAEGISQHPTNWHMLQKLWLSDLDPDRLAQADRAGGRT